MPDLIGTSPRDGSAEAEAVCLFAGDMLAKLRANSHKGHWSEDSHGYLVTRLVEEVVELMDAIERGGAPAAVVSECADVANFAMMIADDFRAGNARVPLRRMQEVYAEEAGYHLRAALRSLREAFEVDRG